MKQLVGFITDYFRQIHKVYFFAVTFIISILIVVNYHFGLNDFLSSDPGFWIKSFRYYLLFGPVFIGVWLLSFSVSKKPYPSEWKFYLLLVISPLAFAVKVSLQVKNFIDVDSNYLNTVLQWPLKALATFTAVIALWLAAGNKRPVAGISAKGFRATPYFVLLLLMLPMLLLAGRGADFQSVYPKLQIVHECINPLKKLVFEVCYGLDFFTIELFFRGFLIIAFIKYGGKDAVLPMAAFYCTIHFGKPLAECISSYFGGLILGSVVYYSRSIWGGLIVHLGIAWMMEVVGVLYGSGF